MDWYGVLQSVLVWALTGGAVMALTWAIHVSKRLTQLEEHDATQAASISKLDDIIKNQVEMSTKLDLLLSGRLSIGGRRKEDSNVTI